MLGEGVPCEHGMNIPCSKAEEMAGSLGEGMLWDGCQPSNGTHLFRGDFYIISLDRRIVRDRQDGSPRLPPRHDPDGGTHQLARARVTYINPRQMAGTQRHLGFVRRLVVASLFASCVLSAKRCPPTGRLPIS